MVSLKQLRQQIKASLDQETTETILSSLGYEIRMHKFKLRESEQTASASVDRDGSLHDFGSGWHGSDIVSLLNDHRGMSLKEATLWTAEQLGINTDTTMAAPQPARIIPTNREPKKPSYDLEQIHGQFMEDRKRVDPEILIKEGNELIDYSFFKSCPYPTAAKSLFGYSSKDNSVTIHLQDKDGTIKAIAVRRSKDRDGNLIKWRTYGKKTFIPYEIHDDFIFLFSGMAELAIVKMLGLSYVMLQADGMTRHLPLELKDLCRDKTIVVLQDNDDSFKTNVTPAVKEFFSRSEVLIIDFEKVLGRELEHGYDFRDICNEIKSAHGVMIMIEEEIIRLQEAQHVR